MEEFGVERMVWGSGEKFEVGLAQMWCRDGMGVNSDQKDGLRVRG